MQTPTEYIKIATAQERRDELIDYNSSDEEEVAKLRKDEQETIDDFWMKHNSALEVKTYVREFREDGSHRIVRTTITKTSMAPHPSEWCPPDAVCTVFVVDNNLRLHS